MNTVETWITQEMNLHFICVYLRYLWLNLSGGTDEARNSGDSAQIGASPRHRFGQIYD